jgi:hypothetical protein
MAVPTGAPTSKRFASAPGGYLRSKRWRAQEDLNPRTRIRSPLLYPG